MPEEITAPTWDSVTSDPIPEAAPVAEVPESPPAVETAPAETPTLETALPLPAEPAARESESPIEPEIPEPKVEAKDEDVQDGDTPQILALPSGSSSRKWAREQFQMAKPVHTFLDYAKPIKEFGDDLYARSESRYFEHVDDVAKHHADYLTEKLFGVKTYDEAKATLTATPAPNGQPTPTTAPSDAITLPTEAELDLLNNTQVAERFSQVAAQAAQKARAEAEAELNSRMETLQKQFETVSGKITTQEQQNYQTNVSQIQDELYSKVWSVVDEGIRDSGLEVKSDDPPKIASLKRAAVRILDKRNIEAAFDESDENRKVVEYVINAARRLEKANAFREEDNLKVRARAAFEKVKGSDEVKAILGEIEAHANQSKATPRTGGPVVPVPGSAAGVIPKSPSNWDEMIQQAQQAPAR